MNAIEILGRICAGLLMTAGIVVASWCITRIGGLINPVRASNLPEQYFLDFWLGLFTVIIVGTLLFLLGNLIVA